ncbi:MAG: M1 family aminopeptidase [Candidatus Bipolaricaulota bacterium]|nr:M1 family aminopeptidase [Candidatus Bipolaricaulota bacterium]
MGRALCLILACCVAFGVLGSAAPTQKLDVVYDAEHRTLTGTLTMSVEASQNPIFFLLLPNLERERNPYLGSRAIDERYPSGFEESSLDVDQVTLLDGDGRTTVPFRLLSMAPGLQTYSLVDTILALEGVQTPSTVEIRFTTHAPRVASGDGGVTAETFTWRFGWFPLLLEPGDALREQDGVLYAGPTDAFPLVFPLAQIEARLTVPAGMVVSAGADHVELAPEPVADEESGPATYTIWNDGPTRSLALTFATGLERYVLDGPTPIEVTYVTGHAYVARLLATYARDILADYVARYGPYPRARLAIVENPNPDGDAFSADGIALLSARYFTHRDVLLPGILHRLTEFVLAHEIAHQWFGMATGIDLDRDAWLSEGLAQYASVGYFERTYGAADPNLLFVAGNGILEDFVATQFGYLNLREHLVELPYIRGVWSGFDEALVKPSIDVRYANENAVRLYDKGFVVARALAAALGDDAFDRVLQRSLSASPTGRLDPETLQRLAEEEAGRPFAEWFAAWVYGDASVDYSIRIVSRAQTEATYETVVRVRREGGIPQAVEVEAHLISGTTTRQTWDAAEEEGTLTFLTPSPVARVTVDPDHRLPDRDRINNNAPVRIVIAADKATMPLDAYVLAPDTGSSGISLSRLDRFRVAVSQDEASLVIRRGRGEEFQANVSIAGANLQGSVGYALTTFAEIETGAPGTTWVPDFTFSVTGVRQVSDDAPLYVLRLAAVRLATTADPTVTAVGLDLASTGAARLTAAASDEVAILPRVYIQGSAFIGFGLGQLPSALQFRFSELHAVPLAPADVKLSGSLGAELPSLGSLPYNLFNIAMIDEVRTHLYIAGGIGWTSRDGFGTTSAGAEAGLEQAFGLSTLGGLLPFTVRLGVAVPIQGELKPVLYVGFSL